MKLLGIFSLLILCGCAGSFQTASLSEVSTIELNSLRVTSNANLMSSGANLSCKSQSGIQISEPHSCWQVFQRNASNTAHIKISGQILVGGSAIQARISNSAGVFVKSELIQNFQPGQNFQLILSNVPAGGWYKLEIFEYAADLLTVVGSGSIEKIGVGEVFVTAGQSNSVGSGERTGIAPPALVSAGNPLTGEWFQAQEPMPFDRNTGGSPWPLLGDLLSKQLSVPVSFTVVGCGGTQISQWLENPIHLNAQLQANAGYCLEGKYPTLNARLKDTVVKLMAQGGLRAILWHQGESDRGDTTANYYNRFKTLRDQLNTGVGTNVNWGVAQATFIPDENILYAPIATAWPGSNIQCLNSTAQYGALMAPIQQAQQNIWRDGLAFRGPNTDLLIGSAYRWGTDAANGGGYCIHFNANGVNAHAQGWFSAVTSFIASSTPPPTPPSTPAYTVNQWLVKTPAERAALRSQIPAAQTQALWNSLSLNQKYALTETNNAYNIILSGSDRAPAPGALYSANQWVIKSPAERALLRGQATSNQITALWNSLTPAQQSAMTVINQAYTDLLATGK